MKRIALSTALACAALAALGAGSAAAATFEGSCEIGGIAKFGQPLTATSTPNTYDFKSGDPTGGGGPDPTKCTGTLNGAAISDAPATATVAGPADLSCTRSSSTGPGSGALVINGITFPFKFEFTALGTEVDFTASGEGGGAGTGHASFLRYVPPEAPFECEGVDANGDGVAGLPQLGFDATFESTSPLTGSAAGGSGPTGDSGGAANDGAAPGPGTPTATPKTGCASLKGKAKTKCLVAKCKKIKSKKKKAKCIKKAKAKGKKGKGKKGKGKK